MLRIAFDAKRAFNNYSGLGNYNRYIIDSLRKFYPENQYLYYTPKLINKEYQDKLKKEEVILPSSFLDSLFPSLWRTFRLLQEAAKAKADIFHGLSNELPLLDSNIKKVVTIHDLIFLRYPELYSPIDRIIYNIKFKKACQMADVVIAISEQTKRDIVDFYNIPESKVRVVYQDCNSVYHQKLDSATLKNISNKYSLSSGYILCVGTLEKRKNQLTLLKAFLSAGIKDLHLVFVGKSTGYKKTLDDFIVQNALQSRISFLSNVPVEDMPGIFQNSLAVLYPSVFEGFGLPVLEGINSGIPVITSKGSCFSEAGGGGALYVQPNDVEELAQAIRLVIEDTKVRSELIAAGNAHALQFRPEKTMPELLSVYQSLI
ncbi:MAG TPA: glycosyltransferase family 1 protein [Cytophagaceae bacterium]